jgi:hypothetical protein
VDVAAVVAGEEEMMAEIFSRGPIVCSIAAVPDFDDGYPANIAKHEGIYINSTDLSDDEASRPLPTYHPHRHPRRSITPLAALRHRSLSIRTASLPTQVICYCFELIKGFSHVPQSPLRVLAISSSCCGSHSIPTVAAFSA